MPFGPLGPSLASYVRRSRSLYGWVKPIADWYANASGYRKYGFKYDDLLVEERADVQKALQRLTPGEQYDRSFRFKRASQASILHAPLPESEWTTAQEDVRYLKPLVLDVVKEDSERKMWDTINVERKKMVCQEFIRALEECHANGWSRFTGACNRQKDELNHCLRSERLKRTSANREAAKARKAKADQALKTFYEE